MQVEGAVTLSVVVRSGPIMTAVNGTVVAQPPSTTLVKPVTAGSTFPHRLSAVRSNYCCMGKPLQTAEGWCLAPRSQAA
jgi:hypothetical protein